ncbi:MAG: hypothetical protein HUU21_03650 [Polyangiaceae bacterium]|nr:hypothetical protein [Polyangiaceae bacterium]NUQ72627.1 hypothetical protein [Polyangiaceae bacterium]
MSEEFDPTPYLRLTITDVPAGIALGVALLGAMPKNAPDNVKKASTKLRMATVGLQEAYTRSERGATLGEKRQADNVIDSAWSALHARLEAYASLPVAHWPRASRAAELLASIFPSGLAFLSLPYPDEWSEGEKRLERITLNGLAKDVDELAGFEFLAEVKRAQQRYGEVLAMRKAGDKRLPPDLTEPLRALGRAVSSYALQVIATNDGSAGSLHAIRQTLKPIDDMRAGVPSRRPPRDEP